MNEPALIDLLRTELAAGGPELDDKALGRLVDHARLLVKWNRAVRLVGSTDTATLARRHILESLALLPYIHEPRGSLLDIGSGNGYPAIPLKCALPDLRVALMEPTMRKAVFLRTVISDLGLTDAEVFRARVDRPGDLSRHGRWDCITMRAVAAIPAVMTGATSALRPSGRLLFMVGDAGRDQVLKLMRDPLALLGESRLPGTRGSHLVVIGSAGPLIEPSETVH